jgi:hypothetical protein
MDDIAASDWPATGTTTVFDIIFASGHLMIWYFWNMFSGHSASTKTIEGF